MTGRLQSIAALSQVLATGILVDMLIVELDTPVQPTVQPAVPPVAAPPLGLEELVAAQQMQLHGAVSTIAAAVHAWLARTACASKTSVKLRGALLRAVPPSCSVARQMC